MKYDANSGETLTADRRLVYRKNGRANSLQPKTGFPKWELLYDGRTITSGPCAPLGNDSWRALVTIPKYEGEDPLELELVWTLEDLTGNVHQWEDPVMIGNHRRTEEQREPVILTSDTEIVFQVGGTLSEGSSAVVTLNDPRGSGVGTQYGATVKPFPDRTHLVFAIDRQLASLVAKAAVIRIQDGSHLETTASNYWVVNPSILANANKLQGWLDKANVRNVIPELRFETSDMIGYLSQGLDFLNGYGPNITSFTGLNMTGVLADIWILCSAYHMCRAQYLAEGTMAFDFSGQAVTLSVDRSQYWDTMAGELLSQIQDRVPKTKGLLGRGGITGGDGDVSKVNPRSMQGFVGLTNTPVTSTRNWRRR